MGEITWVSRQMVCEGLVADKPIRVAVIGGGCAAMAAVWELSRPELNGRYAVTVYQEGWRLGGKTETFAPRCNRSSAVFTASSEANRTRTG